MKTMNCHIAKDLLPNHLDSLNSVETSAELCQHLAECAECRAAFESMGSEIAIKPANHELEEKPIKAMRAFWKKIKLKAFIAGASCVVVVLIFAMMSMLLFNAYNSSMVESKFELFGEGVISPGRYFMNGDTNGLYYQVFDDGTIQLFGDLSALPDAPENAWFKWNRENDFERFDYVVVSHSLTYRGFIAHLIDYPDNLPRNGSLYIYRVASVDEIHTQPQDPFAQFVNGGRAFIVANHVFVRID
jgi:hypothetical protein